MTRIRYDPKQYALEIDGHAGAGPVGEDLVCAAVSILGWTLLAGADKPEFDAEIRVDEGVANIAVRCRPREGSEQDCRVMLDTIWDGFQVLAEQEPEFVTTLKMG